MSEQTQQEKTQEDLNARVKAFNEEFMSLCKKYKLIPGSQAGLSPDGRVVSQFVMIPEENVKQQEKLADEIETSDE